MKNTIVKGNIELDFFDQNPEWLYITDSAKLIEDVGREKASRIMWAIYLKEDPSSIFYRIPIHLRNDEIVKNYLKQKTFDWDKHKTLIATYIRMAISKPKRMVKHWEDKADEMTHYLTGLVFGPDDKIIIGILSKIGIIGSALKVARMSLDEDESRESQIKGGGQISAREKKRSGQTN